MNNLNSIVSKLRLLVSLPLLALMMSAGLGAHNAWLQYKSTQTTAHLMPLATALGEAIHNLQVERGTSAGFSQSQGKKFAEAMATRRSATDVSLQALKIVAATAPADLVRQSLERLDDLPRRVKKFQP